MKPSARQAEKPPSHTAPKNGGLSLKAEDWAHEWSHEWSPPPEKIRMRWLGLIQRLVVGWNTEIKLRAEEVRFRRNITHWIMSERGVRQSLPDGYRVQAWTRPNNPEVIVLVRTR